MVNIWHLEFGGTSNKGRENGVHSSTTGTHTGSCCSPQESRSVPSRVETESRLDAERISKEGRFRVLHNDLSNRARESESSARSSTGLRRRFGSGRKVVSKTVAPVLRSLHVERSLREAEQGVIDLPLVSHRRDMEHLYTQLMTEHYDALPNHNDLPELVVTENGVCSISVPTQRFSQCSPNILLATPENDLSDGYALIFCSQTHHTVLAQRITFGELCSVLITQMEGVLGKLSIQTR